MKGVGHYNLHSAPQRGATSHLIKQIPRIVLTFCAARYPNEAAPAAPSSSSSASSAAASAFAPFTIADFGSSQARNSLPYIRDAIVALHAYAAAQAAAAAAVGTGASALTRDLASIHVVLEDLPVNDWSTVFQTVAKDADTYQSLSTSASSIYTFACGTSFYEQCLASGSVGLSFSCTAMHWGAPPPFWHEIPLELRSIEPSHITAEPWAARLQSYYHALYETNLKARARELVPGGIFTLLHLSVYNEAARDFSISPIMAHLNEVWKQLYADHVIDESEFRAGCVSHWWRSIRELTDPRLLADASLKVVHCDLIDNVNVLHSAYEADHDLDKYADSTIEFFRSWMELALAPCFAGTPQEKTAKSNTFWLAFRQRVDNVIGKQALLWPKTPYALISFQKV